jgi:hypothetical protein
MKNIIAGGIENKPNPEAPESLASDQSIRMNKLKKRAEASIAALFEDNKQTESETGPSMQEIRAKIREIRAQNPQELFMEKNKLNPEEPKPLTPEQTERIKKLKKRAEASIAALSPEVKK